MHWWLPLKGSTFAGEVDGLFLAITIITGIAFVLVEVGLIWFVVKYRQRPGPQSAACPRRASRGGPPLVRGRDPLLLRAGVPREAGRGAGDGHQRLVPGHGPGHLRAGLRRAVRAGALPHAGASGGAHPGRLRCLDEAGCSGGFAMTTVAATAHTAHAHHDDRSFIRKYIFSTDHKIIGIQFLFVSLFFLLVGGLLAMQMRWQLAYPGQPMPGGGILPESMAPGGVILPEYYIQLVTMHGTFMV